MEAVHERTKRWEPRPFRNMEELIDYGRHVEALVREAGPGGDVDLERWFHVRYEDRRYMAASLDELQEAVDELDLTTAETVSLGFEWPGADPVGATVAVIKTWDKQYADLDVRGRKVTAVEGVTTSAARLLDKIAERLRVEEEQAKAEEEASAAAEVDWPPTPATHPPTSPSSPWQRLVASPYSVQIVGGVVAGVVVLVIAALVFSQ